MVLPRVLVVALGVLGASFPVLGQPSPEELAPLYAGLAHQPADTLHPRVPLSTDDPTTAPLVDLQVFAPPVVPETGTKCIKTLLTHDFGVDSYGQPEIVAYLPPTNKTCGKVGEWAAISLNLTVYSCVSLRHGVGAEPEGCIGTELSTTG
jgi:hypothetical protein